MENDDADSSTSMLLRQLSPNRIAEIAMLACLNQFSEARLVEKSI